MTIALIDSDILIHKACIKAEREVWFGEDLVLMGDPNEATSMVNQMIVNVMKDVDADRAVVALTDRKWNFRRDVYPAYKSQRRTVASRKPMGFDVVRTRVIEQWESLEKPGLEADDILGILATCDLKKYADPERIICTIDKDLLTIPGLHYNWDKPELRIFEMSPLDAERNFIGQILAGDSTDGYPGCPGVGPKGVEKILAELDADNDCWWDLVVAAFAKAKRTEEDALTQARCARILQACDYNFKKKEVILWEP